MGTKKRQRSESFQGDSGSDGDARQRLDVFRARMFALPQEGSPVAAEETPRVLLKAKDKRLKKQLTRDGDVDDQEVVPIMKLVTLKKQKKQKEKKKEMMMKREEEQVVTDEETMTEKKKQKKMEKEKMKREEEQVATVEETTTEKKKQKKMKREEEQVATDEETTTEKKKKKKMEKEKMKREEEQVATIAETMTEKKKKMEKEKMKREEEQVATDEETMTEKKKQKKMKKEKKREEEQVATDEETMTKKKKQKKMKKEKMKREEEQVATVEETTTEKKKQKKMKREEEQVATVEETMTGKKKQKKMKKEKKREEEQVVTDEETMTEKKKQKKMKKEKMKREEEQVATVEETTTEKKKQKKMKREEEQVATVEETMTEKKKQKKMKKEKMKREEEQVATIAETMTEKKKKMEKETTKMAKDTIAMSSTVFRTLQGSKSYASDEQKTVLQHVKRQRVAVKKVQQVQTPRWHAVQTDEARDDDNGVDVLEQALGSVKSIVMKKLDKALRTKHKAVVVDKASAVSKVEVVKECGEAAGKTDALAGDKTSCNIPSTRLTREQKKQMRKKEKKKLALLSAEQVAEDGANLPATSGKGEVAVCDNGTKATEFAGPTSCKKKKEARGTLATPSDEPPSKASQVLMQATQGLSGTAQCVDKVVSKKWQRVPGKVGKTTGKSTVVDALAEDAHTKDVEYSATQEEPRRRFPASPKRTKQVATSHVSDESCSESNDDGDEECERSYKDDASLCSRLIDSAARERWELVEVGRLVRLFAAEWEYEKSTTAEFLCETCPELVSVDFLEGLGVNLSAKHLVKIFEMGSGNSGVFMNKVASAVENGDLSVRDPVFIATLERRVALIETNAEVMELLHPLLESLSAVRDVGWLLKRLCEHWHLERKTSLVQQVLLSNVFDDLDGNQDEILLDLPDLAGRLDFPSRLDQEDVDDNGNLKGFLVNDDSDLSGEEVSGEQEDENGSDLSGEEASGEQEDENDSEDDGNSYEGSESDSDDEVEIAGRTHGRNRFIEDEADVGEDDDDDDEEVEDAVERHSQEGSSSSDSDC